MSKTLGPLVERNLLEVFEQGDSARRAAAIAEFYTADCTFFEAEEQSLAEKRSTEGRKYSQRCCSRLKPVGGKLFLPGVPKEALKAYPPFESAN